MFSHFQIDSYNILIDTHFSWTSLYNVFLLQESSILSNYFKSQTPEKVKTFWENLFEYGDLVIYYDWLHFLLKSKSRKNRNARFFNISFGFAKTIFKYFSFSFGYSEQTSQYNFHKKRSIFLLLASFNCSAHINLVKTFAHTSVLLFTKLCVISFSFGKTSNQLFFMSLCYFLCKN